MLAVSRSTGRSSSISENPCPIVGHGDKQVEFAADLIKEIKLMKALLRMTAVLTLASAALCASAEDAASTYKTKCAACHGAAGDANTPAGKALKVPSFSSEEAVKQSDAAL